MKLPSKEQLIDTYATWRLDDVLAIQDWALREAAIEAWIVGPGSEMDDNRVLIVTNDRKPLRTHITLGRDGKKVVFDSNGRRLPRRIAVEFMEKFGEGGIFRGIDVYSGYSPMSWEAFKYANPGISKALQVSQVAMGNWPKPAKKDDEVEPPFILNYLTHKLDTDVEEAAA